MAGQEGNSGGLGNGSSGADEVADENPIASEPAAREDQEQSGGDGGNGGTDGADGIGDGDGEGTDYFTIWYYDAETNEPVYYARVPIQEWVVPEVQEEDSETIEVRSDGSGDVPDFQLMLGTWSIVVIVILFGIFGAVCVQTLIRSLEIRRNGN